MVCFNGTVEVGDFSFAFPDSREVVIPLDDSSHRPGGKSPSYLAMNVIPQETVDQGRTFKPCSSSWQPTRPAN